MQLIKHKRQGGRRKTVNVESAGRDEGKQSGHVGAFYSILDPSAPLSGQTATQQETNYLLNTAFVRTCFKKTTHTLI